VILKNKRYEDLIIKDMAGWIKIIGNPVINAIKAYNKNGVSIRKAGRLN
jgi:hypothetical protein